MTHSKWTDYKRYLSLHEDRDTKWTKVKLLRDRDFYSFTPNIIYEFE